MKIMRTTCFLTLTILLVTFSPAQMGSNTPSNVPITGKAVPGFEEFEAAVVRAIQANHIPGAAIAFVKDGRLVYARGFGWADEEGKKPIEPTSVFRLASISKSLTGIGILKLVQENKLCMEQKVFARPNAAASGGSGPCSQPILHLDPVKCSGCQMDPRIYDITVQDLMQMSGGWITSTQEVNACGVMTRGSGDWSSVGRAQQGMHMRSVPTRAEVIRFGISHRLNFTPGTCYSYANFNFMILGQVIEQITGQPYEAWMEENVLHPMGAMHAHVLEYGKSLPNEVNYYTVLPNGENRRCCVDMLRPQIGPCGGWTASIIDLAHVQASLRNGIPEPNPLTPQSMTLMVSRPANPKFASRFEYWTDGWDSVWCPPQSGGANGCTMQDVSWEKGGDFTVGTITTYASWFNGVGYVLLFNSHTPTNMPDINRKIIQPMVRTRTEWPAGDLFKEYQWSDPTVR
ncbi:MAG: serine hydrolase domain-containing protein [Candidatus Korobacteraceae bacterium]